MPDKETVVMVQVPSQQHAAAELAKEMEELKKNPLDKTHPGGRYLHTDGKTLLDAEGYRLNAKGKRLPGQAAPIVAGATPPADRGESDDDETDDDDDDEAAEEPATGTTRGRSRRKTGRSR